MHHPGRAVALAALLLAPVLAWAAPCPDPVPLDSFCVKLTLPARNVDGTPITDGAGVKVYYGSTKGVYPFVVTVKAWQPPTMDVLVTPSQPGSYYVVATAFNTKAEESAYSGEAVFAAPGQTIELPSRGKGMLSSRFIPGPAYQCNCPSYELATLQAGTAVYVDRADTFVDVGPYAGLTFLRTADADKVTTDSPYITVAQPVLLAWDTGISYRPAGTWQDTGTTITSTATTYRVYRGAGPVESVGFSRLWNDRNLFLIFE